MSLPKDIKSGKGHVFIDNQKIGELDSGPDNLIVVGQGSLLEMGEMRATSQEFSIDFTVKDFEYSDKFFEFMGMGKDYFPIVRKTKVILSFVPSSWVKVKYFFIRLLKRKIL